MVFDISLILTKTISIPARYRYGFWLFLAKFPKKPYPCQGGIDMVFPIFFV